MVTEKIYCQKCEKRLKTSSFMGIIKGEVIHEFKDGFYCDKCGKAKVEKARQ